MFSKICKTWSFHVVILPKTAKECKKIQNARTAVRAIVLLINKHFIWRPSRCRRRLCLLKLSAVFSARSRPIKRTKTNFVDFHNHSRILGRFSFECRKVIGSALTTLRDWLKIVAPLFHPIRSKTKTNCVIGFGFTTLK